MRKVHELRAAGVTILFVSHSMGDVKAIGDRCLWLERGSMREIGATDAVVLKYLAAMTAKDSAYLGAAQSAPAPATAIHRSGPPEVASNIPNIDHRFGDGRAEITGIAVYDQAGNELHLLTPSTQIILRISVLAKESLPLPNVGFMLRNHLGVDFAGTNTTREGRPLPAMSPGDRFTVDFHVDIPELYPSDFSFSPAVANGPLLSYTMCDWIDNAITLQMGHGQGQIYGYMHFPCRVEVNARLPRPNPQPEPMLASPYER
jgi:hypothetical protein